ncbi:Bacteriophytochrome [Methylobrevis pamukkalensis]|uniref:histidine kinase n=1 Tax=Methylobrevis pamukkalensis TaxID=1439726 RepID=A0A1E3H025_9HYPH|nr:Bacteriophytochrome [Methylobrevis pamukkalensis]
MPVPIVPTLDPMGQPLDLSLSVLRSVSPIHIEYLRNMGVRASLSVSIMHRGRLWGLMACHDYQPKYLDFERRTAAELFGRMFSLTLESRKQRIREMQEQRARTAHDKLMRTIATHGRPFDKIGHIIGDLRQMVDCDGVGVYIDGEIHIEGVTPTAGELREIVRFLNRAAASRIYATHELGVVFEPGREMVDRAAGLLAIPISRSPRDYLVFFRRELVRSVVWAGKPEKSTTFGPNGARLSPRKSFEAWRETVAGQSAMWTELDLQAAELVRVSLLEIVLQITDAAERERRTTQERQELLIAELNHRVRNILGLIRGLVSQSRRGHDPEVFAEELNARIDALARAHDQITRDDWKPASLSGLIEAEAAVYVGESLRRITLEGPNALLHPKAFSTMALVFHELMTNAAKYGALADDRGRIAVSWSTDETGDLAIEWRETGGPSVQPTMRRGFGTTIIERTVPSELRGTAEFHLDITGVVARYLIPSEYVTVVSMASRRAVPRLTSVPTRVLEGHCLLVEDNAIIALDAEEIMQELGAASVEQVASVEEAFATIARRRPRFALLDFNLGPETSLPIAERLHEAGIPFVFATGYGEQLKLPEALTAVPIVSKPFTKASLLAGITLRTQAEPSKGG